MKRMICALVLAAVVIPLLALSPAAAAPTVGGKLSVSANVFVKGSPVYITAYNLDASTTYYLNITVGSTETQYGPWTTNSDGDDFTYIWTADVSSSNAPVVIELCSPAGTAVDSVTITVQTVDSLLPTNLIIDLGIALMIMFIIAGIVIKKLR